MSTTLERETEYTGRELRWLADNREQAQRMRIETGERIRAVVQGRDETFVPEGEFRETRTEDGETVRRWVATDGEAYTADEVLEGIVDGWTLGPVAMLGRSYRRYAREEKDAVREFERALEEHPAWPWLQEVKGVGPTLAGKLLSRLDPRKAPHASSFWSYCGLATVPGERYECASCGLRKGWPVGYNVTGKHKAHRDVPTRVRVRVIRDGRDAETYRADVATYGDESLTDEGAERLSEQMSGLPEGVEAALAHATVKAGEEWVHESEDDSWMVEVRGGWKAGASCRGELRQTAGPEDGVRVAQPKPRSGEKASYDQYAKKVCYQIATSILKVGARVDSPYEEYYRRERAKAEAERPGWADGRKRYKALRKLEKLFLRHLWIVWRTALLKSTDEPYAVAELGHSYDETLGPWDMVEAEPPRNLQPRGRR